MPLLKPDFRNLDLSQIWDAIVGSSSSGDTILTDLYDLFYGTTTPSFLNINTYPEMTFQIRFYTEREYRLFSGNENPVDYGGFYPDTFFKIKENTSNTEGAIKNITQFGTTSGRTILSKGADGFVDSAAAALACATWMNSLAGNFTALNITISHIAGVNGHSYAVLYRTRV